MPASRSARKGSEFRVGRVKGYVRGRVWYLCYFEQGKRRRPRVGVDQDAARQLAAQINAQLETGAPSALSHENIAIRPLRECWLEHHEHVRRSSLQTVRRYRTATDHLIRFLEQRPVRTAAQFQVGHAEAFVRYLRTLRVAPNGHPHSAKRALLDKGIQFILETCRSLFVFAAKRRHLSPYADNPFSALELGRLPIEHRRPILMPEGDDVATLLRAADPLSFPILATLALTGMRPGELVHLLVEDFDPAAALLTIRNRPDLGWQTKTRQDRTIPLIPELSRLLTRCVGNRKAGTLFLRPKFGLERLASWMGSVRLCVVELARRVAEIESSGGGTVLTRDRHAGECRRLWRDCGQIKTDTIRVRVGRLSRRTGVTALATPKVFRHVFATVLQEGRVDPLIRNELLGHIPESGPRNGGGLGMTANYTHTRLDTKREQLVTAFANHPCVTLLREKLGD